MGQTNGHRTRGKGLRKRVVVIEPNLLHRRALRRLLQLTGYDVRAFAGARLARRHARACDVLIVVLDGSGDDPDGWRNLLDDASQPRIHNGSVHRHARRAVVCAPATQRRLAADPLLGDAVDHFFPAPLDCADLLRWIAEDGLSRLTGTNHDWVAVSRALNARRRHHHQPSRGVRPAI